MNKNRIARMEHLRTEKHFKLREIGEMFDLSRERVRQLIGNTGRQYLTDTLRHDADSLRDELYYNESTTVETIAMKYHLSPSTVRKVMGPRWKYLISLGLRRCNRCHKIKTLDEFGASSRYKHVKISGTCKECNSKTAKHYYALRKSRKA